jgi:hypothetical protein
VIHGTLIALLLTPVLALAANSRTTPDLTGLASGVGVSVFASSSAVIDSGIVQTNPDLYAGEFNLTAGNDNAAQFSILGIVLKVFFLASQLEKIIDPAISIGAIFLVFLIPIESGGLGWGRRCCRWASKHLSVPCPASLALVPVFVVNSEDKSHFCTKDGVTHD